MHKLFFQLNFWLLTCLTIVIGAAVLTFIEICHKAPSKQRLRSFASELQLFHTFGYMVNQGNGGSELMFAAENWKINPVQRFSAHPNPSEKSLAETAGTFSLKHTV